jgi:hypothetical protein
VDVPFRSLGNGLISKISIPCILPKISNRSRPVACSRSVGTVPGLAPGPNRSSGPLTSIHGHIHVSLLTGWRSGVFLRVQNAREGHLGRGLSRYLVPSKGISLAGGCRFAGSVYLSLAPVAHKCLVSISFNLVTPFLSSSKLVLVLD